MNSLMLPLSRNVTCQLVPRNEAVLSCPHRQTAEFWDAYTIAVGTQSYPLLCPEHMMPHPDAATDSQSSLFSL